MNSYVSFHMSFIIFSFHFLRLYSFRADTAISNLNVSVEIESSGELLVSIPEHIRNCISESDRRYELGDTQRSRR